MGENEIPACSLGEFVHKSETILRGGVTLHGGQVEPLDGLRVVLRHPLAAGVHEAEIILRSGVTLRGGEAVPLDGLHSVLRHSIAGVVLGAEFILRFGVTLLSGEAEKISFGRRVLATCEHYHHQ